MLYSLFLLEYKKGHIVLFIVKVVSLYGVLLLVVGLA